jgi:uncharacterized protein YecE (DUF72 family)
VQIRLGTQGWSYADWVGDMYDAAARPETYLAAYAQEFSTVEIDSTFYGTPSLERVRKWAASVPEGFRFSCKLAREITHERRLLESRGLIEEFYDAMRAFGAKLGCVLVQFDASFGRAEEPALRAALAAFPSDVRTAFEFRDPAWYAPGVQALLEERGFALAVADAPFVPRDVLAATLGRSGADFAYLRWIGDHDAFVRLVGASATRLTSRSEVRVRLREQSLRRTQSGDGARPLRGSRRVARAAQTRHANVAVLVAARPGNASAAPNTARY